MSDEQDYTFDIASFHNHDSRYLNRELSLMDFNLRVLEEAMDRRNPLLERVKFLAIFSSNMDEFFMIRVSAIQQQIDAGVQTRSPDGLTPSEQMVAIRKALIPMMHLEHQVLIHDLIPALAEQGIHLLNYHDLSEPQKQVMESYFNRNIFPVLTPLAFDTRRPFPHISNLSLNLAVAIHHQDGEMSFARVKVPEVLPRLVPLPHDLCGGSGDITSGRSHCFVWIEQLIAAHMQKLFPGMDIIESYPFRVIRNADIEIEEDEADDLLLTIEESLRQRRFGEVVLIRVHAQMPSRISDVLISNMNCDPEDLYRVRHPLALSGLMELMKLDRPDLKDDPVYSGVPSVLRGRLDIFSAIRQQDVLLHHPFDSFAPIVDLIRTAAEDPDVLAIKQTLYRVGSNSPIVKALMHACEQGKQVAAVVELKARFDEENNIIWARALERAGVHVIYGLPRLKIHSKLLLIVRRETDGIRRYVHLGTGNYNASTARIYTDLGLLTCRPDIGDDVSELFNSLTGYSQQCQYRKLLVAPMTLRQRLFELIDREIAQHQQHGKGHMIFKVNSLADRKMMDAFYKASQAGVRVDMIIRGICSMRPGLAGYGEHVRVRSIIGPFLEHSRIYYFANGGHDEVYLSSADMRTRNLDGRVEVAFPVEDETLRRYIRERLLETYLRDNQRARVLLPDGRYIRVIPSQGGVLIDSQNMLMGCHSYEGVWDHSMISK